MIFLDNIINNYLNICSCLIILNIFYFNKRNFLFTLILDVLFNQIPFITITILFLYYINRIVFSKIVKNSVNTFIFSLVYYVIFLIVLFLINNYNITFKYYIYMNLYSLIFNVIIFYIYIMYKE